MWAFKGPHAACGARTGGNLQQTLWPRKAGFQSMGWCGFNWTLIYARRSLELALLVLTGCTCFLSGPHKGIGPNVTDTSTSNRRCGDGHLGDALEVNSSTLCLHALQYMDGHLMY